MKLLFVTQNLPRRGATGGELRQFHLVRGLVERAAVTIAAYRHGPAEDAEAEALRALGARVVPAPFDRARDGSDRFSPLLGAHCAALAAAHAFDVVQIEKFWMGLVQAPIADAARRAGHPRPLFVLDEVDVEFQREQRRRALLPPGPERDALDAALPDLTRRELDCCRAVELVLAITDADRDTLRGALPGLPVHVCPAGADLDDWARDPALPRDAAAIVFVGHYAHNPNVDAACWFVREVLPRVRAAVPVARFTALGARPPPEVRALAAADGVSVPGFMADLRPLLHRATVFVAPLRFGSGTKLKVIEALAAELPVVATSVALEGFALVPDRDVLVADDAERFAAAVVALLCDPARAAALAEAGAAYARAHHDARALARRYADELCAWAAKQRARARPEATTESRSPA